MITLEEKFIQLRKENKKAFIAYIPFGFPDIKSFKKIILSLQEVGVDIVEVGLAFSDPVADGPIIQEAYNIALKNNANIENFFSVIKNLNIKIPIVLMSYYNPIFRFGLENFFKKLKEFNIGILTVDLPFDEDKRYLELAKKYNLETVFLITPTTTDDRAKKIIANTSGFVYYVSVTGITGPKKLKFSFLRKHINELKKFTDLPICVGFGIHNKKQVKEINKFSDGVIVGSSIVKFIKENFSKKNFIEKLKEYILNLKG